MADEIGDDHVEIVHFLMDTNEQEVVVPDNVASWRIQVIDGTEAVDRYYVSDVDPDHDADLKINMPAGHFEAFQQPNWSGKKYYLKGVAGGIVRIEYHKGLAS